MYSNCFQVNTTFFFFLPIPKQYMNIFSMCEAYSIRFPLDFNRFLEVAPMMWVVSAEFHIGPTGSLLQTGLSHFERVLLIMNSFFQGVNEHLGLVDLLKRLKERQDIYLEIWTDLRKHSNLLF